MQLALLGGGGSADSPLVIPWWILLSSLTVVYNSWDFLSCFIGLCIIYMLQLLILAIQEVKNIDSFEEYFDRAHPDTSVNLPFNFSLLALFRSFFKPYPQIIPEEVDGFWKKFLRDMLSSLLQLSAQHFEGRETEANWYLREQTINKMRANIFDLEPDIRSLWLSQIRRMLDGLLKTANSLRTTVSTAGCLLFQDIAKVYGSDIDGMVEILLQNFIKLCANTKLITRVNANDTVLVIIGHVSYHIRIVQHIHSACQDKNIHPRKFACEWLKKVIKRHPRSTIEHYGGLDLIEKSIKIGLEDRDKNVREAMRPTYWNFARRWPERSEVMFASLDKAKQDQLLADPSNPNPTPSATDAQANPTISVSRSTISAPSKTVTKEPGTQLLASKTEQKHSGDSDTVPTGSHAKPTLKEIKAALAKAQNSRSVINVATSDAKSGAGVPQRGTRAADEDSAQSKSATKEPEAQPSVQNTEQKHSGDSEKSPAGSHAKPTLKEIKATLKKAQNARNNNNNVATSDTQPEVSVALKVTHASDEDSKPVKEPSQMEAQAAKTGTISAAPLRRKKTTAAKMNQSQSKLPENEAQGSSAQTEGLEIKPADVTSTKREVSNAQSVESDTTIIAPPSAPTSPLMTPQMFEDKRQTLKRAAFLDQAVRKLVARDFDVEHFRLLQIRLNQDMGDPAWKTLIEPLCEWLETPQMPTHVVEALNWEDEQYYALSTLRLLLSNKIWAETHYPRIMIALTAANAWYKSKSHMLTGIRKGLNFLINHCNVLECLHLLCQAMEYQREETEDELRLLALGAMLHRIHTHPENESEFYHLLGSEAEMVNRLAKIGSNAMRSGVASIRKAAILYAQEFWHLVPEDNYYELLTGGDEKTLNLLKYYISRHKKIDDHVEL